MTEDRHSRTERDAAREEADRGFHEDPWHPLDVLHPDYEPDDVDPWGRERRVQEAASGWLLDALRRAGA